MRINDTPLFKEVWDLVYSRLHFYPSCEYRGHSFRVSKLPFEINEEYAVYAIDNMTDEQEDLMDDTIRNIFIKITKPGQKMYALDWQHSAFLYDPRILSEQKGYRINDPSYLGGGYTPSFPDFYPDGDYYFFIEEHFSFGYLGHPWRQEVWIFGKDLLKEMNEVYKSLGWIKLK